MKANLELFIAELKTFLLSNQIITTLQQLKEFLKEQRGNFKSTSKLALLPNNTNEVAQIVILANKYQIPLVPISGNTGLVGGTVSTENEVILSLKNLNRILEVDSKNQTITLEAGVTLEAAIKKAYRHNLIFPLDLPSRKNARIGGNLSTNAGGLNTLKYGTIKNSCLGLEVVLGNGTIISDLNKLTKRNIGPDYKNLFIGGEGILGIITKATIKLFPQPKQYIDILFNAGEVNRIISVYLQIKSIFGLNISAFEIMNYASIEVSLKAFPGNAFPLNQPAKWYGLIRLDVYNVNLEAFNIAIEGLEVLKKQKLLITYVALIDDGSRKLWQFRDALSDAQTKVGKSLKHDVAVPLSNMEKFINHSIKEVKLAAPTLIPIIFGHIGDQSLHFNFYVPDSALLINDFHHLKSTVKKIITEIVIQYGGNFSAEHGIGIINKRELQKYYSSSQIYMLKLLKNTFDPKNILQIHKIIE